MLLSINSYILMASMLINNPAGRNLQDLLPPVPAGWELDRQDKIFDSLSLFDYIDGGAELYLSYGMKEVIGRIITKEENEIRIEVFDMVEARNAFGVFTNTRLKDEKQYGQGSQYFPGAQIFWKDKYYITVTANDVNEDIAEAIRMISAGIDANIETTGAIPGIIQYLPEQDLQPDGYLYFHHYIWLNSYYYIADDNFLNIDKNTPALLAKYQEQDNRVYLLLIEYPENKSAEEAHRAFREKFMPGSTEDFIKLEDNTWLGENFSDQLLICIFNAQTKLEAETLLKEVINQQQMIKP